MENKLPKKWVEINLKDSVDFRKGKKPKILSEENFDNSLPYMDIQALEAGIIRYFADKDSSKHFKENDVVIVWDGSRSGLILKSKKGAIGSTLGALNPYIYKSEYLYYFLLSQYEIINSKARGVGIPHVDPTYLWGLSLPLPPLPEQERIVVKLETLFAQHEAMKKALERIPQLLKDFRQQVLKYAVTGKLTETWRESISLQDIEAEIKLLSKNRKKAILKKDDKILTESYPISHSIPKSWKWVTLWDLATLVTSGSRDWSKFYSDTGANFVRSAEINNNILRLNEVIKVNLPEKIEGKRSLIEKNNFLITITGANVGKCAFVDRDIEESYVSQSVALIKFVPGLNYKFIHLTILSDDSAGKQLNEMAYGIGRPVLSLPQIKSLNIPFPTLQEQDEIVNRVHTLFIKADNIEKRYKTLKEKIDSLPQAILHKAFKGELVPQLPTDGDAKDLLKEILKLKKEVMKK